MKKNMNERQLAAAIYRLSDPNHAKADLALLVEKSPAIKSSPSFKTINFSPRHNHALILKLLLAVATEQEIEAHRLPGTKEKTPKLSPSPAGKTKEATVPGSSAAGQNIESPAGQNKKKSQKKTNTPTSTGKTSSTKTSSGQS